MNILVTRAAGFIGFHICEMILQKTNYKVYGVFKTHGSNKKILKVIKFKKLSNTFESINKIINWHNKTDY